MSYNNPQNRLRTSENGGGQKKEKNSFSFLGCPVLGIVIVVSNFLYLLMIAFAMFLFVFVQLF